MSCYHGVQYTSLTLTRLRRYPPVYTFLTTGIAGSVTTFSSWMLESYLAFSNFYQYDRGGLHDVRAVSSSRFSSGSSSSSRSRSSTSQRQASVMREVEPRSAVAFSRSR
jgi:hypothetical protein